MTTKEINARIGEMKLASFAKKQAEREQAEREQAERDRLWKTELLRR